MALTNLEIFFWVRVNCKEPNHKCIKWIKLQQSMWFYDFGGHTQKYSELAPVSELVNHSWKCSGTISGAGD